MTVNIALVTSEALVLGCDSIASTTEYFLDPFQLKWDRRDDGTPNTDPDGKFSAKFDFTDYRAIVTNAWGGVTKMFPVHPSPSPMVAVTAGLAKLNDRPISSIAKQFHDKCSARKRHYVEPDIIAREFLRCFRREYERHYMGSPLPTQLWDGPEFLLGGFGRDADFPKLYRIDVKANRVVQEQGPGSPGPKSGVSWNGQSDAVERFIRGYDQVVRRHVSKKATDKLKSYTTRTQQYVVDLINQVLNAVQQPMPSGIDIALPELGELDFDWDQFSFAIDYGNLPLQEAVSFVSAMVNVQASRARFTQGIPTVGGRTHIGVVTKDGFQLLNEPQLEHRMTGFGDVL